MILKPLIQPCKNQAKQQEALRSNIYCRRSSNYTIDVIAATGRGLQAFSVQATPNPKQKHYPSTRCMRSHSSTEYCCNH